MTFGFQNYDDGRDGGSSAVSSSFIARESWVQFQCGPFL